MGHKLLINEGFKYFKQPKQKILDQNNLKSEEVKRVIFNARFIEIARYIEWLANIFLVMKKNGKLWVCINFEDLNKATPRWVCDANYKHVDRYY